jgi:hypothetical protein|tara:strand:+ start:1179 stop:2219 length:1041 start_codon:yes stop_codon:yes gene_type:complete
MNHEQYNTFKDKYKVVGFDATYVKDIPLDQIDMFQNKSQVRTNGVSPGHSKELTAQIEINGGNHTPISVIKNSSGRFDLVAGVHRFAAHRKLYDNGNNPTFGTIKAAYGFHELNFKSQEEQVIYQLNENTPSAQLPCDINDYVYQILVLIKEHFIFAADFPEKSESDKGKEIRRYIRSNIKNLSPYRVGKIASLVIQGLPITHLKYRNYANKQAAAEMFSDINPWGINVEGSGETDKGYVVYFASGLTGVTQNNLHGAYNYKTSHPSEKVLIVAYCGDDLNKTKKISTWRETIENNVNKINSSNLLGSGMKLYDDIVFLPQVLRGPTEEPQDALIIPSGTHVTPTL